MIMEKDEYLNSLYKRGKEDINKYKILIEKNLGNIPGIHRGMEFGRKTLGIVEYLLNNDIVESKKNFYISTLAREWTYEAYSTLSIVKIDKGVIIHEIEEEAKSAIKVMLENKNKIVKPSDIDKL